MITLKAFLNEGKLLEAFGAATAQKAIELITKYLSKSIKVYLLPGYETVRKNGLTLIGYRFIDKTGRGVRFNWNVGDNSMDIYSIDFFTDMKEYTSLKSQSVLSIYTGGASVATILPLAVEAFKRNGFKINDADIAKLVQSEMYSENTNESYDTMSIKDLDKAYRATTKLRKENDKGSDLWNKHDEELAAIRLAIKKQKVVYNRGEKETRVVDQAVEKVQKQFEIQKSSPDEKFTDMESYLSMVTKGIQNCLILCGAPGIGKTYRVKEKLKGTGKKFADLLGDQGDIHIIKGKATPIFLYNALYEYKEAGQILVIDDADSLIGPKAPEDAINLLKAAVDSGDTRRVSWGSGKPPKRLSDPEEILPSSFQYDGSIIIITNYNAGQIDSAVKNRAFVQDMNFTTDEILGIVKSIMPAIMPDLLSVDAKYKALEYLKEMAEKGMDMEISIRSFTTAAKIFMCGMDDASCKRMLTEQMFLQYARGGKKY